MNHPAYIGAISLLAGALLLASSNTFAAVEPVKPTVAKELQPTPSAPRPSHR